MALQKKFRRRKHIGIRYHYATAMVDSQLLPFVKLCTAEMQAVFLTKPFGPADLSGEMRKVKLRISPDEKRVTFDQLWTVLEI